jgi:hypothetical protein
MTSTVLSRAGATPEVSDEPLIGTIAGAEALLEEVAEAVADLVTLIEEETRLVRLGALFSASDLQAEKSRLSARYVKLRFRVRENTVAIGRLPPERIRVLTERHEAFAEMLKINMAVLATAREVAEDIIRNVAVEAGRGRNPATYGPNSRTRRKALISARGIAIDRKY